MAEVLAGLITVVLAWGLISLLAALTRRLQAAESRWLRAAALLPGGGAIWLTYDLVKFILVG